MDNIRGSLLMVMAMLGFAIEDMLIKQMAGTLPVGQIVWITGAGGALVFGSYAFWREGRRLFHAFFDRRVVLRNLCEAFGTIGFVTSIALIPLSTASAILQATPLVVTLGAYLFLGEVVGWRRWTAICIGLFGVLLILRPGMDSFDPLSLFALMGVVGLSGRDLFTRATPANVSSIAISTYAFVTLIPTGVLLLLIQGQGFVAPDAVNTARLGGSIFLGIVSYYAIVLATRAGDISIIAPFRYSRLVFALFLGVFVFGERPDALTLLGSAIIVASGLYSLWREQRLRRASLAPQALL